MDNKFGLSQTELRISKQASKRFGFDVCVYRDDGWVVEPKYRTPRYSCAIVMFAETAEIACDEFAEANADYIAIQTANIPA